MDPVRRILLTAAVALTLVLVGGCDAYTDYVGGEGHGVPCEKLPARAAVETILREHRDVIEQIKRVGPDSSVFVELAEPCPGKADLVIYYPSREARHKIERIIGAKTFYGIPYRLINV